MKSISRILAVLLIGVSLGGCALFQKLNSGVPIATDVSRNTLAGVISAYGIALSGENSLKALPLCRTGTAPSLTNVCVKRSLIVRLQNADLKVATAVSKADAFIKNYGNLNASNVISAANTALSDLESIIAEGKVQ